MMGSALVRALQSEGYNNILTKPKSELDLRDSVAVNEYLGEQKPDVVVVAAARVGGIHANSTYPAEFIFENLSSAMNCIDGSFKNGVKRLLFLGSSCIYPKDAPQPLREDMLLTGALEPTNEPYAIAKIAAIKLCEYYRKQYGVCYHSAMPTNLYGPGDNYHKDNSHVLPALIRKFHEAKESQAPTVTLWGTGDPMREFLHVDDAAKALITLLEADDPPDIVNVGYGSDVSIKQLAELIRDMIDYEGDIVWDITKSNGVKRKLMNSSIIRSMGWEPRIDLTSGIMQTYASYMAELDIQVVRS